MCAQNINAQKNPGLLLSVLNNRCPRCRQGKLFIDPNPYHLKTTMRMPDVCQVCGQRYELQTGFYFGTGYVSYGLSIMISGILIVLWYLIFGLSIKDNSIFEWLAANAILLLLLQPVLQRMARSIWIAFFVRYNPEWKAEVKQTI